MPSHISTLFHHPSSLGVHSLLISNVNILKLQDEIFPPVVKTKVGKGLPNFYGRNVLNQKNPMISSWFCCCRNCPLLQIFCGDILIGEAVFSFELLGSMTTLNLYMSYLLNFIVAQSHRQRGQKITGKDGIARHLLDQFQVSFILSIKPSPSVFLTNCMAASSWPVLGSLAVSKIHKIITSICYPKIALTQYCLYWSYWQQKSAWQIDQEYSKLGDRRSDGSHITLSQSDKWLKQVIISIMITRINISISKISTQIIFCISIISAISSKLKFIC